MYSNEKEKKSLTLKEEKFCLEKKKTSDDKRKQKWSKIYHC